MPREKRLSRSECNSLCRRCIRSCRQPADARLIDCPRFHPFPFKIADPKCHQLDLFSDTGR